MHRKIQEGAGWFLVAVSSFVGPLAADACHIRAAYYRQMVVEIEADKVDCRANERGDITCLQWPDPRQGLTAVDHQAIEGYTQAADTLTRNGILVGLSMAVGLVVGFAAASRARQPWPPVA